MMLRTLLFVALAGACGPARAPETIETLAGPQLGESTAAGPSDPNMPPPDATGVTEVHARLSVLPGSAPAQTTPAPNDQAAPNASEMTEPTGVAIDAGAQPGVFSPPPDSGAGAQSQPASPPAAQPAGPPAMR